jgi:hypothetical protein
MEGLFLALAATATAEFGLMATQSGAVKTTSAGKPFCNKARGIFKN